MFFGGVADQGVVSPTAECLGWKAGQLRLMFYVIAEAEHYSRQLRQKYPEVEIQCDAESGVVCLALTEKQAGMMWEEIRKECYLPPGSNRWTKPLQNLM